MITKTTSRINLPLLVKFKRNGAIENVQVTEVSHNYKNMALAPITNTICFSDGFLMEVPNSELIFK